MKLILKIAVPADYFFRRIIESSLYDIEQQTGKKLNPNQLNGYTFKRKNSNGVVSRMTITAYQPNKKYAYHMHTGRNDYDVVYNIESLENETMNLTYEETIKGSSAKVNANNHVSGFLVGWFRKRRFKKMKRQMESDYNRQETSKN
ncbi:DUF3284 domain-containing protein [Xylocopilactobacillus apis]|uniref:DUF3284 domain-containing protein n=1 Tax=Xylocopilactobacillus apis TaxID=2932183 RepID=A0AAU9DSL3_9LACO|nr:DUF3284 domain-containing protein [Xylocopilactobacillus apis]BDR56688.1 hypothetical protein KIMC2_12500 [Xylocopilactobacillus apis]